MGITVAVKVAHLALPKILVSTPSEQSGTVLVPNLEPYGTVKATVKDFLRRNLFIPDDLQVLQAPLFRKLSEKDSVEDIYKHYACQTETENPDLHLDEQNLTFFAREGGRTIDLDDNVRLEEYHILEKSVLQLRRLPQSLCDQGGRIFVETKDGILPLLGVNQTTQVLELKHALERMTGIPVDQQLLSSVGRSMHDGLCVKDFDGPHRVCEDSLLDLCKSGDSNVEQGHLRMVISVNVMGEQCFTMVVQGRDLVQSVQQVIEARTGVATWQQRITYSGKILQEKRTLSEYFIHPDCTLQVTIFRSPCRPPPKIVNNVMHSRENSGMGEQKPAARKIKLLRTKKGHILGTMTIPVLTTDTISDLKRKVRRTLQPLTERNFVVLRSPAGDSVDINSTHTTPTMATPSPSSKGDPLSASGRRLSRVLSFTGRTFSGPLGGITNTTNNNAANPNSKVSSTSQSTTSPSTPADSNGNKVARALSFKNVSGPPGSPSEEMHRPPTQPAAAPLFPPPLSSPTVSPTKREADSSVPESKLTHAVKKLLLADDLPPASSPLKFVPMRPNNGATSPKPSASIVCAIPHRPSGGHMRAASMGHVSVNSIELHSLPKQPHVPVEHILPHTAPIALGSSYTVSPSKNNNGRVKESSAGAEKRGLRAWLTESIHTLKGHVKSPFLDK